MADSFPIRTGADSALASPAFDDLWLPVAGSEILVRFEENNLMMPLVRTHTIESGNTMKFQRLWKLTTERHARGKELLGLDIELGEIVVTLDERPIVSHFDLDDIDMLMQHQDTRGPITNEAGRALARTVDKQILQLLVNVSREAGPSNGPFPGGGNDEAGTAYIDSALADDGVPSSATSRAAAGALIKALDNAAVKFIQRDIPTDTWHCVVPVALWMALHVLGVPVTAAETYGAGATAGRFFGSQLGMEGGGMSVIDKPQRQRPLQYNGFLIWQSPNIPTTNIVTDEAKYQGDFSNTIGVAFQTDALAWLQLFGVKVETERSARRQTDFFVASTLNGGGALRPQACIELATA